MKLSPDRVRARADALVAKINGAGSTKNEVSASVVALGKLVAEHYPLFTAPAAPRVSAASAKEVVDRARAVASDPQVVVAAAAVTEAARAGSEFLGKVADLVGKARRKSA